MVTSGQDVEQVGADTKAQGTFRGDENVLHLDCNGGCYTNVICQNALEHI